MFRSLRALTFAAALALAAPALAETVTLTFVQTNDIDRMEELDGRGGFARVAAVVKAERAKGGPTFFVHSGDTLSPSLLSGIDHGVHIIDILNHMGVDAMVPGNHEFDFGPEVFRARIAEATFPIVSSNILEADGTRAEEHRRPQDRRRERRQGRLLRPHHRGHAGRLQPRRHHLRALGRGRHRARRRRSARRAPTSSSRWSIRLSMSTSAWSAPAPPT